MTVELQTIDELLDHLARQYVHAERCRKASPAILNAIQKRAIAYINIAASLNPDHFSTLMNHRGD